MIKPAEHRRSLRLAVQAGGFLIGLALLGWAVSMALAPGNREQLSRLADASPRDIAYLIFLCLATQAVNGLIFWVSLLPARRLRLSDVLATNSICSALAFLPFKIGAITRVVIHNRRDQVPILTIGAWFIAVAITMLVASTPPVLAALWIQKINGPWLLTTLLGEAIVAIIIISIARTFEGARGTRRIAALLAALRLKPLLGFLQSRLYEHLHAGFAMLAHPGAVSGAVTLRLLDAVIQALRFMIAARIFGLELPFAPALVISLAYFTIGVVSPVMLGIREAGAIGLAALILPGALSADKGSPYAALPLFVTAVEAAAFLGAGAIGFAWLRPGRLLARRLADDVVHDVAESPEQPFTDATRAPAVAHDA